MQISYFRPGGRRRGKIWAQCRKPSPSSVPRRRAVRYYRCLASSRECRDRRERNSLDDLTTAPTTIDDSSAAHRWLVPSSRVHSKLKLKKKN